jgi:hypothetical protein
MVDEITSITRLVQMAMTPAFMLAGMGAVVSVLISQLARTVDRERKIEDLSKSKHDVSAYRYEMKNLKVRCKLLIWGLYFAALGWFCTCVVVLTIFSSYIFDLTTSSHLLISWLFSISMVAIIIAIALLISEIHYTYRMSTHTDWEFLEK